jgi:ketosteroid isomerase-like protein
MVSTIDLIQRWHVAVNAADIAGLGDLVTDDVEIGGPRGTANGRDVLIDWVGRARIQMEPTDWYQRGDTVVVCQRATWPTEDGAPGIPQKVGTVFVVEDNRISRIARYSGLSDAFAETGLSEADRIEV